MKKSFEMLPGFPGPGHLQTGKSRKLFSMATLCAAALMFLPTPAHAATWEYYTYGGFDSVTSAWQHVALVFSDSNYASLFLPIAAMGVFCGFAAVYLKAHTGHGGSIGAWAVPALAGIVIYLGLVVPKDSLMIYDPVLNQGPVEVSGIPEGIAVMAGILNEIQRIFIDIVDTSSDPVELYQQNAGGKGFDILFNTGEEPLQVPPEIMGTIQQYTKDCVLFELTRPGTTLTPRELETSTDFTADFAKAANPAIYTVSYITNSVGDTMTCQQAWNDPKEGILNAVSTPATWTNDINNICAQSGYDPTIPSELNQCKTMAADTSEWIWSADYSLQNWVMQEAFGRAIVNTFNDASPDQAIQAMAARQTGSDWMSAGLAGDTWIPEIMVAITTIAIAILPILVMFIPTPLVGKAASLIFGMFIWLTSWGLIDVIIHGFAVDYANHVAQQLKQLNLGVQSLQYFPTFGMKVLACFGNMRWFGLMLATVITGMLVKFGGSALARLAGGFGAAAGAGSAAGKAELDPQARGGKMEGEAKVVAGPTESWGLGGNQWMREFMASSQNRYVKGVSEGAALGAAPDAGLAGEAQGAAERGTGELYGQFKDQFGAEYGGAPGQLSDARAENWAAGRPGALKPLQNLNALGANAVPTLISAGAVGVGKQVADEQVFKQVADQYGGVQAIEKDLYGGKLESTVGAINTYGKLTGASSFDQAAAGFFATMGTMGGAQTAGQKAGLEATGPDGSGLAFKTEREMENEYAKFRMLDAAAKAQGMTPMEFLAAHHGNVSFADSKTGGIDTTTMSADGKTLMSTHRAQMSGEKLQAFAQALDQEGMSGTAKELDKLSAQGKPVDLAWATDGAGMLTSFQAASGGEVFERDFSNVKRGREVLSENLNKTLTGTRIDTGLREETGAKVVNDDINKTVHARGPQWDASSMWSAALGKDTSPAKDIIDAQTNAAANKEGDAQDAALAAALAERISSTGKIATFTDVDGRGMIQVGTPLGGLIGDKVSASGNVRIGRENSYEQSYNVYLGELQRMRTAAQKEGGEKGIQALTEARYQLVHGTDEVLKGRKEYTFGATSVVGEPYYEAKKLMHEAEGGQGASETPVKKGIDPLRERIENAGTD